MAAVAIMAATGGYFVAMVLSPGENQPARMSTQMAAEAIKANEVKDLLGQRRPDFELVDTRGAVVSAADFDGRVLLINFWAAWCKPCIDEMPMLSLLQKEYADRGLSVVGIALDDADRAREFASGMDISYTILLGSTDAVLTGRRYGNHAGMLPFSVLVDSQGIIKWSYLGALDKEKLESELLALIENKPAR